MLTGEKSRMTQPFGQKTYRETAPGMRAALLFGLLALCLPATACKQQKVNHYSYHNSAFSGQPGEAWSGDKAAMLDDMRQVLESYGGVSSAKAGDGYAQKHSWSVMLRPLRMAGKNGEEVYALESAFCGEKTPAGAHKAISDLFNTKYVPYTVIRQ